MPRNLDSSVIKVFATTCYDTENKFSKIKIVLPFNVPT